jgi:hypothetical protein
MPSACPRVVSSPLAQADRERALLLGWREPFVPDQIAQGRGWLHAPARSEVVHTVVRNDRAREPQLLGGPAADEDELVLAHFEDRSRDDRFLVLAGEEKTDQGRLGRSREPAAGFWSQSKTKRGSAIEPGSAYSRRRGSKPSRLSSSWPGGDTSDSAVALTPGFAPIELVTLVAQASHAGAGCSHIVTTHAGALPPL